MNNKELAEILDDWLNGDQGIVEEKIKDNAPAAARIAAQLSLELGCEAANYFCEFISLQKRYRDNHALLSMPK